MLQVGTLNFRLDQSANVANLALAGLTLAPLVVKVDPNLNVILTACLTVYVGSYRSVKPTPPSETMSNAHAMRFPFVGSAMLLSVFLLFKFLSKDLVNAVLTCYFFVLGIVALSKTVKHLHINNATLLPSIKRFLPQNWNDNPIVWHMPYFHSVEVEFTMSQVVAAIPGTFFCACCLQGIEMLSLGSFKTGAILLLGLFIYDIFCVFFTPVMVSVAKSFDAPIKLLFPTSDPLRPYSMLGLGDIVIPGSGFNSICISCDSHTKIFLEPALLYIVPAVLGSIALHCIWNDEVKPLLEFNEVEQERGVAIGALLLDLVRNAVVLLRRTLTKGIRQCVVTDFATVKKE
ncbi:hypothetical protein H6P81_007471 [Aristolochia fimbriata]|uniref:Uncharacterized protein n=1 Tax=Aristolochia fimbriata TaxID=158543 RepID=A0AAV7F0G2_ARIFI|nr:hypothetical protein H6P81_007471 [Aristolochia fimbriata]